MLNANIQIYLGKKCISGYDETGKIIPKKVDV